MQFVHSQLTTWSHHPLVSRSFRDIIFSIVCYILYCTMLYNILSSQDDRLWDGRSVSTSILSNFQMQAQVLCKGIARVMRRLRVCHLVCTVWRPVSDAGISVKDRVICLCVQELLAFWCQNVLITARVLVWLFLCSKELSVSSWVIPFHQCLYIDKVICVR